MIKSLVRKIPLIYFFISVIVIIVLFLLILLSSHILNPTITKKVTTASYSNNINYQVYLFNNSFITDTSLGMNQSYISSMVDSIAVNFKQLVDFSSNSTVNYNYTIYAILSAIYHNEDGSDSEIWSKLYPLKYVDTQEKVGKNLALQEQVIIPYAQYQNDLDAFKNTYHLKVDASVDVVIDINYEYLNGEKKNNQLKLSIPLDHEVFKITTDYKRNYSDSSKLEIDNMSAPSFIVIFGLGLLGILEVGIVILLVIKVLQLYSITEYERVKHRIKKDYGSIIVDIDNAIDFKEFTIFEIKSIGELVDLEEELRIPILFYEKKKAKISYFVIIKDHYMYRFTLKDTSQEII